MSSFERRLSVLEQAQAREHMAWLASLPDSQLREAAGPVVCGWLDSLSDSEVLDLLHKRKEWPDHIRHALETGGTRDDL